MALDKPGLALALKAIFEDLSGQTAADAANAMADAIDAFVKTGEVSAGIPITGSSPSGPVTGATSDTGVIV